jgi:hypothetical protein
MQTLPKGSVAPLSVAPLAPLVPAGPVTTVPEHDVLHVSVFRDDGSWRHAAPARSPSNLEADADVATSQPAEDDETLVADPRGGVTPAEMVELKLRSLLRTRGVSIQLGGRVGHGRGRNSR